MAEIGSEEWLNRLSRNQEALKHVDMLPIAAEGQFDPETMKRDVYILKARLKRMGRFLVNPRAKVMQYWDFVILFAMIFTCTVTPYEVCLLWEDQGFGGLFYANIFINVLFIADTVLQFFLPFNVSLKKGGGTVKSHRKIAKHYIESWFVIDFISIFPIDYILLGVDVDSENVGSPLAGRRGWLRHLRLHTSCPFARLSSLPLATPAALPSPPADPHPHAPQPTLSQPTYTCHTTCATETRRTRPPLALLALFASPRTRALRPAPHSSVCCGPRECSACFASSSWSASCELRASSRVGRTRSR